MITYIHHMLSRLDPRLLLMVLLGAGTAAWFVPPYMLVPLQLAALPILMLARTGFPAGGKAVRALAVFSACWACGGFLLFWWEHKSGAAPYGFTGMIAALLHGALLGWRLFLLGGFALGVPVFFTPVLLGRTADWFLTRPAVLEEFTLQRVLQCHCQPRLRRWAAHFSLALALMTGMFAQALRDAATLREAMRLRSVSMPARQRMLCYALFFFRVFATRSGHTAATVVTRGLCNPTVWRFRAEKRAEKEAGKCHEN